MSPDEGKVQCKFCSYKGHAPLLRVHLELVHDITFEDEK